jgi:hypothetical protein
MADFLPTREALVTLARLADREPDDPAVVELFDQLVLRGHLTPWLPGWWELIRCRRATRFVAAQK